LLDTSGDFILLIARYFSLHSQLFKSNNRDAEQADKRQESAQKQTSPRTENPAIAGFLLGDYRPNSDIPVSQMDFRFAATPVIRNAKLSGRFLCFAIARRKNLSGDHRERTAALCYV